MDFNLPPELANYLKELDRFIEAEIRPLELADDNIRFFDHRREHARTDWDRGGLPREEWEDLLREAGLPYVVVLTDPTFGGVSASYAMLGDIQIAEPGAQIGFTGARVIAQTIREKLPEGFQRAEYLLEHGMLDMVTHRKEMRATLSRVLHMLMKQEKPRSKVLSMPVRNGSGRNGNSAATP